MIDSHCHLDDARFDADREAVIERALEAGVEMLLAVGTGSGPPDLEAAIRIADAHAQIYASVGVHPHDASKATAETFERLGALLAHPKVLALGEIGLDYHYNFSPPEVQRSVFARQLEMARAAARPVIIHTREAWADTLRLIGESGVRAGIMHCFSEGPEEAEQALGVGFHVSFAGVVTFPKAVRVQAAARMVPEERLLIETDAPYLAPVPHRGKRNEPAFAIETARKLAELRGVPLERVAAATADNFRKLFGFAPANPAG
jgi:TatD DNase family protein